MRSNMWEARLLLLWKDKRRCLAKGQMRHLSVQVPLNESTWIRDFKWLRCFNDGCPSLVCQEWTDCLIKEQTIALDLTVIKEDCEELSLSCSRYNPCHCIALPILFEEYLSWISQES